MLTILAIIGLSHASDIIDERIVVLNFTSNDTSKVLVNDLQIMSAEARMEASFLVPDNMMVMSVESMISLVSDNNINCFEDSCVIDTGRKLGATLTISGSVLHSSSYGYCLETQLNNTLSGELISSKNDCEKDMMTLRKVIPSQIAYLLSDFDIHNPSDQTVNSAVRVMNKDDVATIIEDKKIVYDDLKDERHREDSPATERPDVKKKLYLNDKVHREYGPTVLRDGRKFWWLNGIPYSKLHRVGGPAVEYPDGTRWWCLMGRLHREDGPAIELSNGRREWWINGWLHREDGPAIEGPNGEREWYLNGEQYSQAEWEKEMRRINK